MSSEVDADALPILVLADAIADFEVEALDDDATHIRVTRTDTDAAKLKPTRD